jgi:HD-GYP domain-containing protein (c-di-GMP phosphodiesterase class II)
MEEARAMSREKPDLLWVRMDGAVAGATEGAVSFAEEPFPPREPGDLIELVSSIRLHGILSPLLVRPLDGKLQVVCGYRRYLAARAAGLVEIPALVAELDDAEAIRSYLSENGIRRPIDSRAEEEAIQLLRSLRDRSRTLPGDEAVEPEALPIERQLRLESVASAMRAAARMRYLSGDEESAREEGDAERSRPRPSPEDLAWRLLERMESFLGDVLRERKIDVRRANSITDILLEVVDLGPLDWRPLARGGEGDITAVHSLLTGALCARTASVLDWSGEDSRTLVLGGVLHDVGMVFLQKPSLRSPRTLSPAERGELEGHTRIGCALIGGAGAWRREVSLVARDHHERWNGTGYPEGKRGAEVEIYPRLLAPLDTFAALIMPRPHRDALSPNVAFERLSKAFELGLYDPALVPILTMALGPDTRASRSPSVFLHPGAPTASVRNSIELGGGLATMLSKEST